MEFGPVIKNPVLDINRLVRQGTMLNQSVQTVEGDSTADQATVDLLARKDPVIQEISVGISGEELTQYTVSGTPPISLPNSLGKPLKAWSVDLLPYQEGTGDPSPDNVRPIYGTDKLTITTAGKNLLEPKFYGNVAYNQSVGGKAISTSPQDVTSQVTVNGNTYSRSGTAWGKPMSMILDVHAFVGSSLTLSGSTDEYGTGMRFGWYVTSEDYTVISRSGDWTRPVSNTFNIQAGDYYIILYINSAGSADAHITEPMIEVGITATPYTPYLAPSQTALTLPQTVYTGTIGSDGGESRWGEVDLGSLNWEYMPPASAYPYGFFYVNISKKKIGEDNVLCEIYALSNNYFRVDKTCIGNTGSNTFYIIDSEYTDTAVFKAAMSGVQLIYELATPTTFAVPSATIPTPTGTATTWATAEDGTVESMEVTYVGKV